MLRPRPSSRPISTASRGFTWLDWRGAKLIGGGGSTAAAASGSNSRPVTSSAKGLLLVGGSTMSCDTSTVSSTFERLSAAGWVPGSASRLSVVATGADRASRSACWTAAISASTAATRAAASSAATRAAASAAGASSRGATGALGAGSPVVAASLPGTGIVISKPSLIRSGLPPMNARGFAAKIFSASCQVVLGARPSTRAAIVDRVSPSRTR